MGAGVDGASPAAVLSTQLQPASSVGLGLVLPLTGCPQGQAEAGMPKGEVGSAGCRERRWGRTALPARLKCGGHLLILPANAEKMGAPYVIKGKLWLFFSLVVWLEGEDAPVSLGAAGLQLCPPEGMRAALGAQRRVCLGPGDNCSLPWCVGDERASEEEETACFQLLTNNLHRLVSNRNTMALSNGRWAAASSHITRCEIRAGIFFSCNRCSVLRCLEITSQGSSLL